MTLLAYSLLLKYAKTIEPQTLRYSIGYQVMANNQLAIRILI